MSEQRKKWKLAELAKEFNVSLERITEVLHKEGYKNYKGKLNEKVTEEVAQKLARHFKMDQKFREMLEEARRKAEEKKKKEMQELQQSVSIEDTKKEEPAVEEEEPKVYIHDAAKGTDIPVSRDAIEIEKDTSKKEQVSEKKDKTEEKTEEEKQVGPKVVGRVDLDKIDTSTRPKKRKPKEKKKSEPEPHKEKETKESGTTTEKVKTQTDQVLERTQQILSQIETQEEEKKTEQEHIVTGQQETGPQVAESKEKIQDTEKEEPQGLKIVGKIDLEKIEKKEKARKTKDQKQDKGTKKYRSEDKEKRSKKKGKKKRIEKVDIEKEARRIKKEPRKKKSQKEVIVDQKEVEKSYKETIQQAKGHTGKSISKKKFEKKKKKKEEILRKEQEMAQLKRTLTITEFLTLGQLASLMDVNQIELMQRALELGIHATVNYPLEAEEIELLAESFGYEVDFVDMTTLEELEAQVEDKEEDLKPRPPIVTVMGHVDHGKTSLLDFIRNTNVVAGEAGGITQHIGAYNITLEDGKSITFIDTPGHEAFTAMRARGAKITDIAIIVVAADDGVRPQTEEALDHAKAAGVPIIFAINKVDKDTADPERVRRELAEKGYVVSSWGGDYFDVEVSAKTGHNIDELLETILLVAEDLDLKANPNRLAVGTVLEASVEKGRGPVANVLVRTGTLHKGDIILAGSHYGRVRAMFNERMKSINEAGPSMPAQVLGLDGVPEPGEPFVVMDSEKEARQKANQRAQIKRVIERRSRGTLTLEEISRRLQVGEFSEINIIIRADVQGTADALAEQLEKLSTDEVKVNVIRKATGEISESDVMLAQVSKAVIIGFQVRPSVQARKAAEQKKVEIRTYSVIYQAIDDIKDAIRGLLKPIYKEEFLGSAKVLKTFKIKGVGTVAGCIVEQGKIARDAQVRVVRNGVVIYEGDIESLKRYQEDVQEVKAPQECGIGIKNFNDIKKDDVIEAFRMVEQQRDI